MPGIGEDIEVVSADRTHAAVLAEMHQKLFLQGWSDSDFLTFIENECDVVLVAIRKDDRRVAGFSVARIALDEAEVLTVGVAESFRQQRIGYELSRFLQNSLREKGVCHLFLELRAGNIAAAKLYEKSGFELVAKRKGYYSSEEGSLREDALIMKISL